jgi:hypothetical protein
MVDINVRRTFDMDDNFDPVLDLGQGTFDANP